MLRLETPLSKISFITPRFLKSLEKLGLKTVGDLVFHFPSRYEDFSQTYRIADLEPGQQATIQGLVKDVDLRRSWRRRMTIVEAVIEDESGSIKAVWFNQPYLKNILRPGRLMNFSGKVSISDNEIYLSHPDYELAESRSRVETRHTGRLVPIYPETRGLTSRGLRYVVQPVLKNLDPVEEFIPEEVLIEQKLPGINEALQKIHFPDEVDEVQAIKNRFAFQDLFLLQLFNFQQKLKLAHEKSPVVFADIEHIKKILSVLPFELTASQKKSLWEIIKDLERGRPMNRLLQGDVGSGKTIVAAIAALVTARAELQSAFMAPTEVLANQHFRTIKKLFEDIHARHPSENLPVLGIITSGSSKISFADGLTSELTKGAAQKKVKSGEIRVVIGTHSLIQKSVTFHNLGLTIIDEQHRFGVRQRAHLMNRELSDPKSDRDRTSDRRKKSLVPHFLSMSATPIPRTLMLTIFGDLDVSVIDELPAGRKEIKTRIVSPEERTDAYGLVRREVAAGRQVFVICPRIEPTANDLEQTAYDKKNGEWGGLLALEAKTVKEEYEKLSKKIFPNLRVAMLHGKMKSAEKEKIMVDFKAGGVDILVSTSVIEVGVDVPNATIMVIEGSERFGLAQLYQFRGRVGRGEHQSYCFLFTESSGKATQERLEAIVGAKSGFELAEKDLKLRGPGEFLGTGQAGLPDMAMRGLQDFGLIKSSREAALSIIKSDSSLKRHPLLAEKLAEFQRKIHQE
ncbi:MAG: ATP-dependent DNA helicase RecG [Parcubacteria group bacterium Gr01-1014_20]|nr:MAG: ATP-dependent DNA helicase RecG [Parcubacteria group bacterium Gr01-1014_20]